MGSGETFLETELPYLAAAFERVILFPFTDVQDDDAFTSPPSGPQNRDFADRRCNAVDAELQEAQRPGIRPVPTNVQVDMSLGQTMRETVEHKPRAMRSLVWHDLPLMTHTLAMAVASPRRLARAFGKACQIDAVRRWFAEKRRGLRLDEAPTVAYSYWTTYPILGLRRTDSLFGVRLPIYCRAHGYDLYEDIRGDADWPFREELLRAVDRLFCVCEHGRQYLVTKRPWMQEKVAVHRLGVEDHGRCEASAPRDEVRFCSCSSLLPLKRVNLIVEAIALAAGSHPEVRFRWDHIGSGPQKASVQELAARIMPPTVECRFRGQLGNREVRELYSREYVDAFLNVSSSEGAPVSIMEAQSAGIPVIATAVGGTPELVNHENGLLLSPDPPAAEVARALGEVVLHRHAWVARRAASRRQWESLSNAEINYRRFVDDLRKTAAKSAPRGEP